MNNESKCRYPYLQITSQIRTVSNLNRLETPIKVKIPTSNSASVQSHGSYGHLLFDERWRSKRASILKRDNFKCVVCAESNELQVHHRQYHFSKMENQFKVPWDYDDRLLITLCKGCHNKGHSKFKVPTISIQ